MRCEICGNNRLTYLGVLGSHEWFKCRTCGWQESILDVDTPWNEDHEIEVNHGV